jgi:Flp pilus assembly pilin Flp
MLRLLSRQTVAKGQAMVEYALAGGILTLMVVAALSQADMPKAIRTMMSNTLDGQGPSTGTIVINSLGSP